MNFFHEHHTETQIIHNQKIYFEPHLHYEVEIITLYKGSTALTVGGKDYRMEAGDFLIVFPNTVHSYTTQDKVDVGKFIFSPKTVPELKDIFQNKYPRTPIITSQKASEANLATLSGEILDSYQGSSAVVQKAYLLLLTGKLLELCELEDRQKYDHDMINQIFHYCQNNYRKQINQKIVAKALHISVSHLSHIFSTKIEMNFCNYINILRINEACELILQSDKSLTQIAEECGFESLRTFNRAFLKHRGITPTQYRQHIAGQPSSTPTTQSTPPHYAEAYLH